ncbi:MAG: TPMT family class I SAM-dependent methyltransferase [Bacteroidia bacterium]|nr:TPMT family class I SAM-dependent methyltransferase [Bacteroidia bacterium]
MSEVNLPEFWDEAYRSERDGWDMGTPTPVFDDILRRNGLDLREIGGADFRLTDHAPRAALPCSGRGYDALLFARYGFDVTAIDFSSEALKHLRELTPTPERLTLLHADLFDMPGDVRGSFHLIVEYTCVCAVDPSRRAELVRATHALLRPDGYALMLLFPIDGRPGGPPFSIDVDVWKQLMSPYFNLTFECTPTTSVKPRMGRERLMMWKKKEAGDTP